MKTLLFEFDTIEAMRLRILGKLIQKKQLYQKSLFRTNLLLKFFKDREKSLLGLLKQTNKGMSTLTQNFMWERMRQAGLFQRKGIDTIMKPLLNMVRKFQRISRLRYR